MNDPTIDLEIPATANGNPTTLHFRYQLVKVLAVLSAIVSGAFVGGGTVALVMRREDVSAIQRQIEDSNNHLDKRLGAIEERLAALEHVEHASAAPESMPPVHSDMLTERRHRLMVEPVGATDAR